MIHPRLQAAVSTALALLFIAAPVTIAKARATAAESVAEAGAVAYAWEVVSRRPHDVTAFTQGLELDPDGRLFESTGVTGSSTLREVDARTGEVLRQIDLPPEQFGEGITLVDDRIIGLTWRSGVATAWGADTFEPLATYAYAGEGWGLCYDGERLVMSDGSDVLTFRDASTFEVVGAVSVTLAGEPLADLNELECVGPSVWANVYTTDTIVEIDPDSGEVVGRLELNGLIEPHPASLSRGHVLNGIAYDAGPGTFLVTGKDWPELIEIRLTPSPVR